MLMKHEIEIERTGGCLSCGKCCQLKYTWANMTLIAKLILRWNIFKAGARFDKNAKCPHLNFNKRGKASCNVYHQRPDHCRIFPVVPGDLIPECGYKFEMVDSWKEGKK